MNVAVFGYGYMGKVRHRVLSEHPRVSRVVVVDPHQPPVDGVEMLQDFSSLKWDEIDAVFVCTPNSITADLCVEGLKRVGRVFCEKPPGRNWSDFCRIQDAADSVPGHTIAFGFNHRLHPSVQAARAMIGERGLGDVLYVKGTYGKSGGARYRESWRNDREISGGGILLDQGIHMLDIFQLFVGPLTVVDAVLVDSFWGCGVEDNAFVLLRSQAAPVFLHSSATLWKHTFRFEVGCRDGYLVATGLLSQTGSYGREQLVIGKRQFEDEALALGNPREEIIHFDRDESWSKEIDEFISAIGQGRPSSHGSLDDARMLMRLVQDVYDLAGGRDPGDPVLVEARVP